MKKDISNIIDLDSLFENNKQHMQTVNEGVEVTSEVGSVDFDEVLSEWSYRLPKGYPTMVDGVFAEEAEVEILNQLLEERGLQPLSLPNKIILEAITTAQLSTNPTDVKEAMVCLFVDAGLTDKTIIDTYRQGLDKKLDPQARLKLAKTIKSKLGAVAKSHGSNYGISGYAKMADYVSQAISDPKAYKADIIIINNGLGAADAIIQKFSSMIKPGMVARDDMFNDIRAHAVELINSNYQIKGYYPDNWCPGDIYFYLDLNKAKKALATQRLNVGVGSLNDYFYGTTNTKGPILAVSLKMQQAQAGKGTTFIKNVVVDGVTAQDKLGKDNNNQQVIKFRDLNRRLEKYYFNSDEWKQDEKAFDKVRQAVAQLNKMANAPGFTTKDPKEIIKYLNKNKDILIKTASTVGTKLTKSIDTVNTFQQAYTRFVKNLQAMNIKKVEGNSKDFVKKIEDKNKQENGGKVNATQMQGLLSQKAATYDLASTLIEKWTEKTKRVSPAFAEHLNKVKNPFVAITMFAIAQHGLNPNFFKAIGKNDGSAGTISEFPTNSVVDESKSVQQLKVIDSPGQAGFYIEYLLNINGHNYKTVLVFRFSKDAIRIEVEELSQQ